MECEKMKKALALALVISMAMVGTMFAQAVPDVGANPYAPGQQDPNPGHDDLDGKDGAPGQTGENPGLPHAPGQQDLNPGHDELEGKDGAPGQTGENPGNGNEPKGE